MTHQNDFTVPAELIRIMINATMQAERAEHLKAGPYQHTPERRGYANGFKPKTMKTRVGEITFSVPQVREGWGSEQIHVGAQVIKNRSTGDMERFLSSIRFKDREKLEELGLVFDSGRIQGFESS